MTHLKTWFALLIATWSAACTPTLDWREFVPEGSGLSVSFPCRPDRHARDVMVAGAQAKMDMLVCTAGDTTFALSFMDVAEPARTSVTLAALRASAVGNVQGVTTGLTPWQIKGATPNEQSQRLSVAGRRPDGAPVQVNAAFFTRGLRVYQATVIGVQPAPQAVEAFFSGLKFPA
jgi:hypothetical protein